MLPKRVIFNWNNCFPWVLVFGLGNSNGWNTILWNFQGWSFILSGISEGKVTKSKISMGPLQKSMSSTPSCFDFFWNSPIYFFLVTETGRKLGHNQLFSLSQFCPKNWARWVGGSKKVTIFEKKKKTNKKHAYCSVQ